MTDIAHRPVLVEQAVEAMAIRRDGCYVDGTFGRGGHAEAIIALLDGRGRLLCLDKDPAAVAVARARYGDDRRVEVRHASFAGLAGIAAELGWEGAVDGILLDLGVSSPQLEDPARGFSFHRGGPLDMRMDPGRGPSAADWLATAEESEMTRVFRDYGEERHARRIARAIADARARQPIATTDRLAEVIAAAVPGRERHKHPATRCFQAIRIYLNGELDDLRAGLAQALDVLHAGGRLVVISFHSLEDRIVKRFIRDNARVDPALAGMPEIPERARPRLRSLGRARRPDAAEVRRNPRARSAVMRAAERLA